MPKFRGSVRVQFRPKVSKAQVIKTVEDILKASGCTGCGLLGVDLHLHGGDPLTELFDAKEVAGVIATSFK